MEGHRIGVGIVIGCIAALLAITTMSFMLDRDEDYALGVVMTLATELLAFTSYLLLTA